MQDGPDFLELGIFLLVALVILATVVIFLKGVEEEIRLRLLARRRRIDTRPGFSVAVTPKDPRDASNPTAPPGSNP